MSDIKVFRIKGAAVEELKGTSVSVEKSLQNLIEKHLEAFLGVQFLASEYSTGKKHGGRIDTLGIDENGSPVIIEYKRAVNENVINQGLYVTRRKVRFLTGPGKAVPGADQLAIVATENPVPHQRAQVFGNRFFQFNREVGNAFTGIDLVGADDGAGGAGRNATDTIPAVVLGR